MDSERVPYVLARGGTSKCVIFEAHDLPADAEPRDGMLLRAFGGPDPHQIDGIGGATQATSKALIVEPGEPGCCDIRYTFAQIVVGQPRVDYGGNCGNCLSAVASYAVDSGYVDAAEPVATVRVHNTNTDGRVLAEVPTADGGAATHGDCVIDGVPGAGAPIKLWFEDPGGSVTGSLLPTCNISDRLELGGRAGLDTVEVSVLDAGTLVVFVRALDVGVTGTEDAARINDDVTLLARLEAIRGTVAAELGFVDVADDAANLSPSVPKIAFVSPKPTEGRLPEGRGQHVFARILAGGKAHRSYAITGGIATAVAATYQGTLVQDGHDQRSGTTVTIHHPAGALRLEVDLSQEATGTSVRRVAVFRTSRRLADGFLYLG